MSAYCCCDPGLNTLRSAQRVEDCVCVVFKYPAIWQSHSRLQGICPLIISSFLGFFFLFQNYHAPHFPYHCEKYNQAAFAMDVKKKKVIAVFDERLLKKCAMCCELLSAAL